ncbi:MAG: hypothetical protein ABSB15_20650 [Bryobacteraceae bacterium]
MTETVHWTRQSLHLAVNQTIGHWLHFFSSSAMSPASDSTIDSGGTSSE